MILPYRSHFASGRFAQAFFLNAMNNPQLNAPSMDALDNVISTMIEVEKAGEAVVLAVKNFQHSEMLIYFATSKVTKHNEFPPGRFYFDIEYTKTVNRIINHSTTIINSQLKTYNMLHSRLDTARQAIKTTLRKNCTDIEDRVLDLMLTTVALIDDTKMRFKICKSITTIFINKLKTMSISYQHIGNLVKNTLHVQRTEPTNSHAIDIAKTKILEEIKHVSQQCFSHNLVDLIIGFQNITANIKAQLDELVTVRYVNPR
jgi:hypothetical protein